MVLPISGLVLQLSTGANNWVGAGSVLVEEIITVLVTLLAVLAFSIQVARGYFLRVLRKFTLRFAADIWWLVFVLLRDAGIFLVLFLGITFFWPGTYEDYALAMPFQPLAIDFFVFALVLLLLRDTNEDPKANTLLTIFISIGTALLVFGTIFITYNPVQAGSGIPTVSANPGTFWGFLYTTFSSISSPTMAIISFYITLIVLALGGSRAIMWSFEQWGVSPFPIPRRKAAQPAAAPQAQK